MIAISNSPPAVPVLSPAPFAASIELARKEKKDEKSDPPVLIPRPAPSAKTCSNEAEATERRTGRLSKIIEQQAKRYPNFMDTLARLREALISSTASDDFMHRLASELNRMGPALYNSFGDIQNESKRLIEKLVFLKDCLRGHPDKIAEIDAKIKKIEAGILDNEFKKDQAEKGVKDVIESYRKRYPDPDTHSNFDSNPIFEFLNILKNFVVKKSSEQLRNLGR
jgi:hypothetical protein